MRTGSLDWFTILLLGHMTTAPWNMFINNQGFIEKRLNYVAPVAKISSNATAASTSNPDTNDVDSGNAKTKPVYTSGIAQVLNENKLCSQTVSKADKQQLICMYEFCSAYQAENRFDSGPECPMPVIGNSQTDQEKDTLDICFPDMSKFEETFFTKNIQNLTANYNACKAKSGETNSAYAVFWANSLTTVALAISFISTVASTKLVQIVPEKFRIKGVWSSVVVIFVLNLLFSWIVYLPTAYFVLTLGMSAIIIFTSIMFQSTAFSITGQMDFKYIVCLMEGQGLVEGFL